MRDFWILIALVFLFGYCGLRQDSKISDQERQIKQVCDLVFDLTLESIPSDQLESCYYDKLPAGEYKMIFADHRLARAIIAPNTFEQYDNPRYIYVQLIPDEVLEYWVHDSHKKIPED